MLEGRFDDEYLHETEQSSQFKQEYEMRKIKQASSCLAPSILYHSIKMCVLLALYSLIHPCCTVVFIFLQDQGLDMISDGLDTLKNSRSKSGRSLTNSQQSTW